MGVNIVVFGHDPKRVQLAASPEMRVTETNMKELPL
jgi:hypothetical protein